MKLFCILGMHRSGTSIVARLTNLLGASLGPEEDLMHPKPDNPKGFWESASVVNLHNDLFSSIGGAWDRPPFVDDGGLHRARFDPYRKRIHELVSSHFSGHELTIWKDPRGSFTLPLWREVIEVSGVIIPVRRPAEVAASLLQRNGISTECAAYLWLRYMVAAWRSSRDPLLIRYEDMYDDPVSVAKRVADYVGLPQPAEETSDRIVEFVDPELRHHKDALVPLGPYMVYARGFYHALLGGPLEVVGPFADLVHDRWKMLEHAGSVLEAGKLLERLLPR